LLNDKATSCRERGTERHYLAGSNACREAGIVEEGWLAGIGTPLDESLTACAARSFKPSICPSLVDRLVRVVACVVSDMATLVQQSSLLEDIVADRLTYLADTYHAASKST
jgi:hypothetical protein